VLLPEDSVDERRVGSLLTVGAVEKREEGRGGADLEEKREEGRLLGDRAGDRPEERGFPLSSSSR
jgi:hypothetical protein